MTIWESVFLANQGPLHGDVSQQQELIHNDTAKEDSDDHDRHLGHPKMTVQTQKDRSAGDYCKLQAPCIAPVRINRPSNYRVDLPAATFQNNYGKKGIENIQPCDHKKVEKQTLTVAVNVTAFSLILRASERTPSAG